MSKENKNSKTLGNTTASKAAENVKDIKFWGDGDTFKLVSKAHSDKEGWLKSTKVMEILGVGCVIQVTTQQGDNVAEALTTVPGTYVHTMFNDAGEIVGRRVIDERDPAGARFVDTVFVKDGATYQATDAVRDIVVLTLKTEKGILMKDDTVTVFAGELDIISRKEAAAEAKGK